MTKKNARTFTMAALAALLLLASFAIPTTVDQADAAPEATSGLMARCPRLKQEIRDLERLDRLIDSLYDEGLISSQQEQNWTSQIDADLEAARAEFRSFCKPFRWLDSTTFG